MIITVFSPVGGVGKTTIALAVSQFLGKHGSTCLVEMDFTPGDVTVFTGIELKAMTEAIKSNPALVIQRPDKANFDVLTGGYPDTGEVVDYDAVVRLIDELKMQYQYVVIDCQSFLTANVVAALLAADTIVVPVVDEVASVAKLAGILEYLENNKYADVHKAVIVANRSGRKPKYVLSAKLPVPIICHVPTINKMRGFVDNKITNALMPVFNKWVAKPLKRG